MLGRVLLDSFLKLFTGGSSQSAVPRSGLPAPELPSYDEDESEGPSELNLLLNAYKGQQAQEDLEQSLKEVASKQMGSYAAAADVAKARLLAEAMNAFGTPSSVL